MSTTPKETVEEVIDWSETFENDSTPFSPSLPSFGGYMPEIPPQHRRYYLTREIVDLRLLRDQSSSVVKHITGVIDAHQWEARRLEESPSSLQRLSIILKDENLTLERLKAINESCLQIARANLAEMESFEKYASLRARHLEQNYRTYYEIIEEVDQSVLYDVGEQCQAIQTEHKHAQLVRKAIWSQHCTIVPCEKLNQLGYAMLGKW